MSEAVPPIDQDPAAQLPPLEAFDPNMTQEELEQRFQINVVDLSHGAVAAAQDHAAEYVNKEANKGGNILTRFARKIWHGNLARDYYTIREKQRGLQQITESGNIYELQENATADDHSRTAADVVGRVAENYLHQDEVKLQASEITGGEQLQTDLHDLVKRFASDRDMTREALVEARTQILKEFGKGKQAEDRHKGLLFADNLVEVADNARLALDSGLGMDRIDQALKVSHAEARMGARTELRLNAAEKVANQIYKTRVGSMVNETTLAAAISIPFVAGKVVTRKLVTAATAAATLGAGSAVIAGVRESLHIKQDRQAHMRDMATGGGNELARAGKRREALEETRYRSFEASDLMGRLRAATETEGLVRIDVGNALEELTLAETLVRQSDERSMDLVTFSSRTAVESERFALDVEIAKARVAVQDALNELPDDARAQLGIETNDINTLVEQRSQAVLENINEDVTAQDKAFRSLQRKEALKAALIAGVTSETIGLGIQEVRAAFSDQVQGVFEHGDGQTRRTLLAGIFRHNGDAAPSTGDGSVVTMAPNGHVDVPAGYHLTHQGDKWELFDSNNKVVDGNVTLDANGNLSADTLHTLREQGFGVHETTDTIQDPDTTTYHDVSRTAAEYINHHPHEFTTVHRDLWYDNNTPGVYDKNELGLWWGGNGNTGVDANGNYVFDVAHMNPDGSFHDGLSTDAQQLIREGKMSVDLSVTEGTQQHIIAVHVDEHGQAIINKDSFAGHNLFRTQDGHAEYLGKYAEAAQNMGIDQNGVETTRMLATYVGHDQTQTVMAHVPHVVHHSHEVVTTHLTPPAHERLIEVPGAIPVRARGGLEYADPAQSSEDDPQNPEVPRYGYNHYSSPESIRHLVESPWISPNLRDNPEAQLNQAEELAGLRERLASLSPDYLAELDAAIAADPVLSNLGEFIDGKEPMRALVTIPVYGAGEQDNIYRTLSNYAVQDDQAQRSTPVLLHVNWPEKDMNDPEKSANIAKTMAEIERARQDFPGLQVAAITTQWPQDEYDHNKSVNGGIIRPVVQKLFDAAMLSVDKGISEGRIAADQDIVIIRNDADTLALTHNYVGRMIDASDRFEGADAFSAPVVWESRRMDEYPGFAVAARFRELMQTLVSRRTINGEVSTIGMNTAIRVGSLAAIGGVHTEPDENGYVYMGAGSDDLEVGNRIYALRVHAAAPEIYAADSDGSLPSGTYYRSRRAASSYTNQYQAEPGQSLPAGRRPIEYVPGSALDTMSDRLLDRQYRNLDDPKYPQGRPIAKAWDDFSSSTRSGSDGSKLAEPEDLDRNPDQVIDRLEFQLTNMIHDWYSHDPSRIRLGLKILFGEEDQDGNKLYDLERADGSDDLKGIRFTSAGRRYIIDRLRHNSVGRRDPLHQRVRRLMYGESGDGSTPPLKPRPMFVSGTA